MANKRDRSDNWNQDEKLFLLEICRENVKLIEDKHTDGDATKRKERAWSQIEDRFMSKYGRKRDKKRLKEQWNRLKLKAKKEYGTYKKKIKKTGGGPPPKPPSGISEEIHQIVPEEFTQLENPYDDDQPSNNLQAAYRATPGEKSRDIDLDETMMIGEVTTYTGHIDSEVSRNIQDIDVDETTMISGERTATDHIANQVSRTIQRNTPSPVFPSTSRTLSFERSSASQRSSTLTTGNNRSSIGTPNQALALRRNAPSPFQPTSNGIIEKPRGSHRAATSNSMTTLVSCEIPIQRDAPSPLPSPSHSMLSEGPSGSQRIAARRTPATSRTAEMRLLELYEIEHKRKMEMLEEEHQVRMRILGLKKERTSLKLNKAAQEDGRSQAGPEGSFLQLLQSDSRL